jgi:CRISPR/Cas system CSM-associated protein Csm2 small subunit
MPSFLELKQRIQLRKAGIAKRHEQMQSNLYLQRAMRRKFFNEVHRSMTERAGNMVPDLDQYQPFVAQQRLILTQGAPYP